MVRGQISDKLSTYNMAGPYKNGDTSYITAAWGEENVYAGRVPKEIRIGNGSTYTALLKGSITTFTNVPLSPNTEYNFFTRYDIRNELDENQVYTS